MHINICCLVSYLRNTCFTFTQFHCAFSSQLWLSCRITLSVREASSFLSLRSYSDVSIETGKHNPYLRDLYGVTGNSCPISPDTSGTRELALGQRGLPLSSLSCVVSVPWFILDLPMPNQSPHIFFFSKAQGCTPYGGSSQDCTSSIPVPKAGYRNFTHNFFSQPCARVLPELGREKNPLMPLKRNNHINIIAINK